MLCQLSKTMYAVASSTLNNGGQAVYVQRARSSGVNLAREARCVGTARSAPACTNLLALWCLALVDPPTTPKLTQVLALVVVVPYTLSCVTSSSVCISATYLPAISRLHEAIICLSPRRRRSTLLQSQGPPIFPLHRDAAAMVYITSDLFGPAETHSQIHHHWHTMTDPQHDAASLGKRKRTHDGDAAHVGRGSRPQHTSAFEHNNDRSYVSYAPMEHRPVKQVKRISPKVTLVKSTSHVMDTDVSTSSPVDWTSTQVQLHAVTDLRACHACKSAPKRRKDLENYMDCKRCVGRTCYICARQCLGGCGKKVCRECTAEVGQERDSWCLDCLQRDQYMK